MPRSVEQRVQALLNRTAERREVRTAAHTTVVLQERTTAARGPGRPKNSIVVMEDGELKPAGHALQRDCER
jgi:hypothetical protein